MNEISNRFTDVALYQGDCLEVMQSIPTASVDAVVTDPPYSINTKSDGSGKLSPWADRINSAFWYTEWMKQARRILKPTGCLWSFFNWRSFVTFQKSSDDMRWPIESLLVWDKCCIGPGGMKGLRPSYEFVGLWAMDKFAIDDRGIPDIRREKWSSTKPNGHPAEKPEKLITWLIQNSTKPGDLVVDLFMGSGTTGVACVQTGRSFIGIELDETYFKSAQRRINDARARVAML